MTTIFKVETEIGDQPIMASLEAEELSQESMVELIFRAGSKAAILLKVEVNLDKGTYMVKINPLVTGISICLAGCGVSSFAGVIIDCWGQTKSSNNRRQAFIACLQGKGVNIASSYTQCAIGCLTGGIAASIL